MNGKNILISIRKKMILQIVFFKGYGILKSTITYSDIGKLVKIILLSIKLIIFLKIQY
jgi:hypothetical protein